MRTALVRSRRTMVAEMGQSYPSTDAAALRVLARKLAALAQRPDSGAVVVDLAGSEDFGAGMIGALIRLHREAERHGKSVVLCGLSAHALRVLRIARLDRVWNLAPSRAAACALAGRDRQVVAAPL